MANQPIISRNPRRAPQKEEPYKINNKILAQMVRLVGENVEQGIYSLREALQMAEDAGLDLVEISPAANPPVCKVVDYRKFLYDKKKKQKDAKAKTTKIVIKELRLSPNTDDHDFNFKLNHATRFLQEGSKVKVDVYFKGRSIVYKSQGETILLRFAQALIDAEVGKVEMLPKLEGKRMMMIVAPKK